ncbi:uncharacterized protein RCO7_02546 [Rhynchosporium graminicola]|uniref:NACHT-NTPase and P-loop NTPases N-terminal domain-containing protein n=1 Tax=Rhynchosporium graminicola TaxID=2792576 RepID=A0A1E1JUE5_9HELO|nr:uncharacterized protein RCO7_02546 [Rhynchosporium commune]
MADPLSTAGTAAYGEEIAYLVRKTETIQDLLQCLEGPLRKAEAGSGDVSVQVRNNITACESGVRKLVTAVQKYGNLAIPTNTEDRLRAVTKRLLYPFKRSTLQDLSLTLEEILGNLK